MKVSYESIGEAKKLREKIAAIVFVADSSNDNLDAFLILDANTLLKKYDEIIKAKELDRIRLEETAAQEDMKNKLRFQTEQKYLYEKQQNEIFKILDIPFGNQTFSNVLSAIKDLRDSSMTKHEDIETEIYSNAERTLNSNVGADSTSK